jgi:hypothetical protein
MARDSPSETEGVQAIRFIVASLEPPVHSVVSGACNALKREVAAFLISIRAAMRQLPDRRQVGSNAGRPDSHHYFRVITDDTPGMCRA